jgi:glycerate kinase
MRILIAPDKFKGTLSAPEAAEAIASRLVDLQPNWAITRCPLADGGDGTLKAVLPAEGKFAKVSTLDAMGRSLENAFGLFPSSLHDSVLIESASCLGLSLLPPSLRDPEKVSSFGLGLVFQEAFRHLPNRIILALGGTGTVDGGLGFLQALGTRFETADGLLPLQASASAMGRITAADLTPTLTAFQGTSLEAWCDVFSPLLGPTGAARMFGPQKGATPEAVERLELGMSSFASVLEKSVGRALHDLPGVGAAGGLGLAVAALGGQLKPGFISVAESVGLEEKIRLSDIIVTGEGRLDASTRQGKAPWGILEMARRLGKPCYAIAGSIADTSGDWTGAVSLFQGDVEPDDPRLIDLGPALDDAVRKIFKLIKSRES